MDSPKTYPFLWKDYSGGGNAVIKFLNYVAKDRWSCMETTVDGETTITHVCLNFYPPCLHIRLSLSSIPRILFLST